MGRRKKEEKQLNLLHWGNDLELPKFKKRIKLKKAGSPGRPDNSGQLFENLIDVETTAEVLGVAPKTVRKWVCIRFIPYIKVGRRVMFRPKSLELWLNQKETKSWL